MGKMVQVKSTITTGVRLPPANLLYLKGETTTLTEREYSGLTTSAKNAVVVIKSGLADPVRYAAPGQPESILDAFKMAKDYTDTSVKGALTVLNQTNHFAYRLVANSNGSYPSRPSGVAPGQVVYVGPNQPTDWTAGDAWDDTSGTG